MVCFWEDVVENHLEFLLVLVHFSNKSERSNTLRMQSSCRVDLVLHLPSQVADAGKKEKKGRCVVFSYREAS